MEAEALRGVKWYSPIKHFINKPLEGDDKVKSRATQAGAYNKNDDSGLGPNSHEERMPHWLVKVLAKGDRLTSREARSSDGKRQLVTMKVVETPGLVHALARLSRADPNTVRAIYCSNHVHHVAKLRREGSFCGYRNVQMMISYICNAHVDGCHHFDKEPLPSVFVLQDLIEQAWEKGFNTSSRDQVGRLRMTRKFIGTSEVEALFLSLNIAVETRAFTSTPQVTAYTLLVKHVLSYFEYTGQPPTHDAVVVSQKPPIFLQRYGHSVTIIGIDKDVHETYSLLVFDPKYQPSGAIEKVALEASLPTKATKLLKPHRYGSAELARFDAFEIVQLENHVTVSEQTATAV